MIITVNIADAATADIEATADAYDGNTPGLGTVFIHHVNAVIDQVQHYPETYQVVFAPVRRAVLHRFPFNVFYHVRATTVEVLGVLPCRADPEAIRQRITAVRGQ